MLYGGYSRVKTNTAIGKQTKNGAQASKTVMKPTIHQDTWFLRVSQPSSDAPVNAPPVIRWERRKKPTNPPNPPRAGVTQAYHKGRGIMFGGVHDVEETEDGIESEFFDQLFAWNIERNRFFPLGLKRAKAAPKRQTEDRGLRRGRGKADEEDLLRNLAALEMREKIADRDDVNIELTFEEEEDRPTKPAKPVLYTMPHPRFNAQLAVQGDVLYIYGGTYEHGDREFTFDEMHAVDLGKLDGVQEIYRRELENWQGDEADRESESDEDDESEDADLEEDGMSGVSLITPETPGASVGTSATSVAPSEIGEMVDIEGGETESTILDNRPHPRPFENLREFFARTSNAWQELVWEKTQHEAGTQHRSIKELRKIAFDLAETKWWDCREEISAEEERQEEAGIGEVFNLADRTVEVSGAHKRR